MIGKNVPIPERMQHLEKDRRGYPIPANVLRDVKGLPVFTINNVEWVEKNQMEAEVPLCGICGTELELGSMYFVGGPASTLHPNGAFADGPMHHECANYAVQVCPYLVLPKGKYAKRLDAKAAKNDLPIEYMVDFTQYPDKPPVYLVSRCVSFNINLTRDRFIPVSGQQVGLMPEAMNDPAAIWHARYLSWGAWVDGEYVDDDERIMDLVKQGLMNVMESAPQAPRVQKAKASPKPSKVPCGTCPYRMDVPSGVWAESEYLKLPEYDKSLLEQAQSGTTQLFYCHQNDGSLCAGWCGTHDMQQNLAVRVHPVDPSVFSYESPIPLFSSGAEACEHGVRDIDCVSPEARRAIEKLERQREEAATGCTD